MFTMSGSIRKLVQKFASVQINRHFPQFTSRSILVHDINATRTLYCKASLGIDNFEIQKGRVKEQLSNLQDKFKERMREYVSDENNMIFTEDLKNMVYLSETDEDVELLLGMMNRFNKQNQQLRFGDFKFGPIVMRLFHVLNKPELAMKCFKDQKNFSGFFDQLITFEIYLDLLFNNKMYEEVLEGFQEIVDKQLERALLPRNPFIITIAACYKLNTKESYDYATNIWKKGQNYGYHPTRRAATFFAGLALNQGHPEIALELVSSCQNQNYTTIRNIKALALTEMGRIEEAVAILKSVLSIEKGEHTFNQDVIDKIKSVVLAMDNSDNIVEFKRVVKLLEKQGNIASKTLDEQLCSEIKKPPPRFNSDGGDYRNAVSHQKQSFRPNFRRPGLKDMN